MRTCPSCGEENADKAKFCSECATPLGVRSDRAERKVVTALFCDLVGSTSLGETHDPEVLKPVLRGYFDEVKAAIERHGGRVEKYIGDAVAAVFGMPAAHEDDALRAVRAAADIQQRVRTLNEGAPLPISCRVGVNTGEVLASGDDTPLVGDAMNTAARLQGAAEPGGVLLGDPTYRLVGDAVRAEPVGPVDAKGKAEPVAAWRLLDVIAGAEGHSRRLDSVMVGRDGELMLLRQAFERSVRDRACMLFTVFGTAGVGKSRLAEEFLAGLGEQATLLRGRCLHYGEGITYWPVVEVLTRAAGIADDDAPDSARSKLEELLRGAGDSAIVVERLANLLGVGGTAAPDETHWAIRKLLEHVAHDRPLVVVFDDIHWGEPTFLDLIEHIADWSREAPILVLCMARPEMLDDRPTWGGGKLNSTTVLLEPLEHEACHTLLTNLLGEGGLEATATERILSSAAGNPLFVEEMLRMLVDRGLLAYDDGVWTATQDLSAVEVPPTIQALLTARLDRLQRPERSVLERGAVEGNVFHRGAVATLLGPESGEDVGRRLMDLTRKELIRPDRADVPGEDAFRFRHLLIRDAAYQAMPKELRADLHERFADWLLAAAGERAAEFDEIAGHHLEQARSYLAELGSAQERLDTLGERAARHLAAGAQRADERGDLAAAENLAERAAALMPADDPGLAALLALLGSVRFERGALPAAVQAFEGAETAGVLAGDERSIWWARSHGTHVRMLLAPNEVSAEQVSDVARAAVQVFERLGDDEGLAFALDYAALYRSSYQPARDGTEMEARERALARALRSRSARAIAWVAGNLCFHLVWGSTPLGEAEVRTKRIFGELASTPSACGYPWLAQALIEAFLGRSDRADEALAESMRLGREFGNAFLLDGAVPGIRADVELAAGDVDAAFGSRQEVAAWLEARGERSLRSTDVGVVARLQVMRGEDEDALQAAAGCRSLAAPDDVISQMLWRQAEGQVLVRRGSVDEGLALIRVGVELGERSDWSIFRSNAWLDLARALVDAGRGDEAIEPARTALALLEEKGAVALIPPVEALLADLGAG